MDASPAKRLMDIAWITPVIEYEKVSQDSQGTYLLSVQIK